MKLDLEQLTNDVGEKVGYVHGNGGGFFFTWADTLADTVDSIDEDEIEGNGGLDPDEVKAFLRANLASHFATAHDQVSYRYAKRSQGFEGSLADWLDLDADERAEYENGAAGIGN